MCTQDVNVVFIKILQENGREFTDCSSEIPVIVIRQKRTQIVQSESVSGHGNEPFTGF